MECYLVMKSMATFKGREGQCLPPRIPNQMADLVADAAADLVALLNALPADLAIVVNLVTDPRAIVTDPHAIVIINNVPDPAADPVAGPVTGPDRLQNGGAAKQTKRNVEPGAIGREAPQEEVDLEVLEGTGVGVGAGTDIREVDRHPQTQVRTNSGLKIQSFVTPNVACFAKYGITSLTRSNSPCIV